MPFHNVTSHHFSDKEKTDITAAVKQLTQLLRGKLTNLTPRERQKYGRVHEQNKLLIHKVYDYHSTQPQLSSPDVDWEEFERDYESRQFLENTVSQLRSLITGITNTKILHDWDNYQNALSDYSYAQYKCGTAATAYEHKVKEIRQFFNRSGTSNKASKTTPSSEKEEPGTS